MSNDKREDVAGSSLSALAPLIRPSRKDHMPVLFEGSKARFQGSQHRHSYPRSFASFECVCDDVALAGDTVLAFAMNRSTWVKCSRSLIA
jgi:hypothetical protein